MTSPRNRGDILQLVLFIACLLNVLKAVFIYELLEMFIKLFLM